MKVLLCFISICCFGWMTFAQNSKATKMELKGLKNLYQLNDSIFRSEQPNNNAFKALESRGVKTILNLRRLKDDDHKARNTDLVLKHLRLKSKEITETDIIEALRIIKNAEKPLLIHCWHGSDRTGIVSAAYRIIFEDWSKEDAIAEFRRPAFGYHENWYPNLLDLLNALDIPKIKKELDL